MPGRLTLFSNADMLSEELGLSVKDIPPLKSRYNIPPTQPVAALVQELGKDPRIEFFQWGLVPVWAKDPSIGEKMFNARAETIATKPSFKGPLKNSRCLVIIDGFYEWKKIGDTKQPYFIRLKSKSPFTLAGLWSHWTGADGSELSTCTVITIAPNKLIQPIHQRMPAIIPSGERLQWIYPENYDPQKITLHLKPYPSSEMEAYEVSPLVNLYKNDVAECIQPLES